MDRIIRGDARAALAELPDACVALAVTSPPYWNVVDYGMDGQIGQTDYERYLDELTEVWRETERVLIGNGKLAVVTPVMPVPKSRINDQHTRHLKNIAFDIEARILREVPGLRRFGLFVWKKQTTTKMFGSYPYPPNIYEDNTIEFVNVYVKDGAPPAIPKAAKEPSRLTQEEWRNLTMQIWPIYPEDVKRAGGHPAPFPTVLPQRLILMYTFRAAPEAGFRGGHRAGHVQRVGGDDAGGEGHGQALDRHRPEPGLLRARRAPPALGDGEPARHPAGGRARAGRARQPPAEPAGLAPPRARAARPRSAPYR